MLPQLKSPQVPNLAQCWHADVRHLPVALQVRLLLLAALAGEHLLLLGPPGTAKSELSRRMARLTGGTYFERLLTRFSVPEELFGPLSMKGKPYLPSYVLLALRKLCVRYVGHQPMTLI